MSQPLPLAPSDDTKVNMSESPTTPRTLVLCFDGTANEFGTNNTNVVQLFSFLEKENRAQQMVYYQTGVGTYTNPTLATFAVLGAISKALDLAVAWYLDAHVIGGYEFLMQNYQHGDRICLFGFSRGAYTARALAGMLSSVGLLPPSMPEQVPFAYSMFKKDSPKTRQLCTDYRRTFSRDVSIQFIGVWDTVASVGSIFPRNLPFASNNYITKTFRHAVSLDEHRAKFRSNLWHREIVHDPTEISAANTPSTVIKAPGAFRKIWDAISKLFVRVTPEEEMWERSNAKEEAEHTPTDVKEVHFSGCHCDVGGGNVEDHTKYAMSNIPLRWMIKETFLADVGIRWNIAELDRKRIPHPGSPLWPDGVSDDNDHDPRRDAISPTFDELKHPKWWLLEFLPFVHAEQDELDRWVTGFRINLFRPRSIPKPPKPGMSQNSAETAHKYGVNIPPQVLFHTSVKVRMEAAELRTRSWKSWWRGGENDVPYRPRAWPQGGEPEFVD